MSWPTSTADRALVLTKMPESDSEAAAALAAALTTLSAKLWRTYTHPASSVPDASENLEQWRREQQRSSVETVLDILPSPNVPDGQGNLLSSYDPVVEAAHKVVAPCSHSTIPL